LRKKKVASAYNLLSCGPIEPFSSQASFLEACDYPPSPSKQPGKVIIFVDSPLRIAGRVIVVDRPVVVVAPQALTVKREILIVVDLTSRLIERGFLVVAGAEK